MTNQLQNKYLYKYIIEWDNGFLTYHIYAEMYIHEDIWQVDYLNSGVMADVFNVFKTDIYIHI